MQSTTIIISQDSEKSKSLSTRERLWLNNHALDGGNIQEIAAYYGVTSNLVETKWGK